MFLADKVLWARPASQGPNHFGNQEKLEILEKLWPQFDRNQNLTEYEELLLFISDSLDELRSFAKYFAFDDFGGLFDVIKVLRDNHASTKRDILTKLKTRFSTSSDDQILKSMELTVRLWLGINVNFSGRTVGRVHPRRKQVHWMKDQTLDAIAVVPERTNLNDMDNELDGLTAANIVNMCRVHIEWTDCLNDHLRLSGAKGKRILHIYQQKKALMNHKIEKSPLLATLLDEIIRSLELLLPLGAGHTRKLLKSSNKTYINFSSSGKHIASNLDEFVYLRPRLKRLLDLYHGPPESFLQWLFDTRDIGQLAALWVGISGIILTILIGIVASIYAIKQYFVAVQSYDLSWKSYQLSLKMACGQNATMLGQLCD